MACTGAIICDAFKAFLFSVRVYWKILTIKLLSSFDAVKRNKVFYSVVILIGKGKSEGLSFVI